MSDYKMGKVGGERYTSVTITPAAGYVIPSTWEYEMVGGKMTRVEVAAPATVVMDQQNYIRGETGPGPYGMCEVCLLAYRKVNLTRMKNGKYRCGRCV